MAFVIRAVTKGLSNGLGLAGEKYHDHKDRKAALAKQDSNPTEPSSQDQNTADDERIWALDEAGGDPPGYEESQQQAMSERTVSELVQDMVTTLHVEAPPRAEQERARLPYPVIIPQRRPGTKERGFARAYPPDLEAFDFDQDSFLRFLQNFEDASQASPWLNAVYLTAGAIGFVPGHITMAVAISVQIAAGTAIELQSRYKANAFLDQMNKELFMPLGLYAMVLLCKDGPEESGSVMGVQSVNLENAKNIAKWGLPKDAEDDEMDIKKSAKLIRPIRLTSGKTKASEMPLEIAPLIYPGLEDMIEHPAIKRDENFKERLMRNKLFVAEYFDRRAQAEYTGNNPDAALTKASSSNYEFKSRFADPNHPCNNGHLFSLVTGGKIVAQPLGGRRVLREKGEDGKLKPKVKQVQYV
ncbi:hypothetical protein EJ04DRAFT_558693 [Polyplosphaeria fusca]|uniref:Uncharacterized protein n=1 Tax=Polyplosphaeria fusca TaxID=682080 RepID=A0A9P4RC47_9PLEO|nr:hypothetical protein EJ04DRAFT_558693 [Polyplosphaeria fusca]